jgi:hypothetical protein
MQSTRWIGCGPVCSCDPWGQVARTKHAPNTRIELGCSYDPWGRYSMQSTRWIGCGPGCICDPWGQVARTKHAPNTRPELGCSCDPWGRYSMQSTRWIECGLGFIELHPEPGCSCDPLRAGFRCSPIDGSDAGRVAVVIRCGPCCRLDPGVCFDQTKNPSANVPRFCGQNAEQRQPRTPSRVAVAIRYGPVHRATYRHRFRNRGTSCNAYRAGLPL